jgi:hypothetical protein
MGMGQAEKKLLQFWLNYSENKTTHFHIVHTGDRIKIFDESYLSDTICKFFKKYANPD